MGSGDGTTIEHAGRVDEAPPAGSKGLVDLRGVLLCRTTHEEQSAGRLDSNLVGVGVDLGAVLQPDAPLAAAVLLFRCHDRRNTVRDGSPWPPLASTGATGASSGSVGSP